MSNENLLSGIKTKSMMIAVALIEQNLFVRKELNTDHAMYLALLIDSPENGVVLPPILVIPEYEVVDGKIHIKPDATKYRIVYGRHRLWAEDKILDHSEIKALVIQSGVETEADLISLAYRENCGGSLPPTSGDTEHSVEILLGHNVSKKEIALKLGLPASLARKFINSIESRLMRARVRRAVYLVIHGEDDEDSKSEGITVAKAAGIVGVSADLVRAHIADKKPSDGKDDEAAMIVREIRAAANQYSNKVAGWLKSVFTRYDDGDVDAKYVRAIFKLIADKRKSAESNQKDWEKRFDAKVNGKQQ